MIGLMNGSCQFLPPSATSCTSETSFTYIHIPYHIDNNVLPVATFCRDLGVTIADDLYSTMHATVQKDQRANAILCRFATRDKFLLVNAFKTYVRPIVEYVREQW